MVFDLRAIFIEKNLLSDIVSIQSDSVTAYDCFVAHVNNPVP